MTPHPQWKNCEITGHNIGFRVMNEEEETTSQCAKFVRVNFHQNQRLT